MHMEMSAAGLLWLAAKLLIYSESWVAAIQWELDYESNNNLHNSKTSAGAK